MRRELLFLSIVLGCSSSSSDPVPPPADSGSDAIVDSSKDDSVATETNDATDVLDAPSSVACSAGAQDCPAGKKCTLQNLAPTGRINRCVDEIGTKKIDEACTRTGFGDDDCARGGLCTTLPGAAIDPAKCRKLCTDDSDCPTGRCYNLGNGPSSLGGVCLPTCTLFGTDCGLSTVCWLFYNPRATARSPFCSQPSGKLVADGSPCAVTNDCGNSNAICLGVPPPSELIAGTPGTCTPLCDPTHACGGSLTCSPLTPAPSGVGTCK